MKKKYFIIAMLFSIFVINAQIDNSEKEKNEVKLTFAGTVLDNDFNYPIFGADIMLDDKTICFSNENGKFTFELDASFSNESITIKHQSFNPIQISLSSFEKKTKTIELTRKITELDEVVITVSKEELSLNDILKQASIQFKNLYRYKPYWSGLNYKQAIYDNGVPDGYLEFDGHIFMTGEIKKTFAQGSSPITIPNEMRRLNENPEISDLEFLGKDKKENPFVYIGSNFMVTHWDNYQLFEIFHPLTSKGKRYFDFSIEKKQPLEDGLEYYIISFKQKKQISNSGWPITHMKGEIWLRKDSFVLRKINVEFKNGWQKNYIRYDIDYTIIENKIYPNTIGLTSYKYISNKSENHNIVKKGLVKFIDIDSTIRPNYSLKYGGRTATVFHDVHEKYNPEYWENRQLENLSFKNDVLSILGNKEWRVAFKEGAKQREYKENSGAARAFKTYEKNRNEILEIMNKDLNLD